ncbi:MAG TPA: hypothetical protein VK894_08350 [Jiangellales bacterium]|nr:hypothetical protein [Jiangellales bacterium]
MTAFTMHELQLEHTELLPTREALGWGGNWAGVYASNAALALNAVTIGSLANATANQAVLVFQG